MTFAQSFLLSQAPTVQPDVALPGCVVLLLHGLGGHPDPLRPFASALAPQAVVQVPAGPVLQADGNRAWWPVDQARRQARLAQGPVDLAQRDPDGRDAAHAVLAQALADARRAHPGLPVVLAGYSQGGMLALDHVLTQPGPRVDGLALLSASRIALPTWLPRLHRLAGLPVLVAHGRQDADLSFAAGEGLRDLVQAGGARVRWLPFDGGHELPMVVWRALRRLVAEVCA